MADLVIKIREYIGESSYNWLTDEFEWATNCDDLRMAIEYAGYTGQEFDRIVLEIGNCYGGSVREGMAMFHYLQELDVPILTRIMGTVASMGTIIPLAGDEIECAQTAQFMVHSPSDEFWGTASQIAADLKGLQDMQGGMSDVYVARTSSDAATVATWLTQDTWFTAAEALAAGLCTSVLPLRPKTAPAAAPATEATAQLRRKRFAEAVARADKRTFPTAKNAAPAAPLVMPNVQKPIGAAVKPTPRAAAKPAAKPAPTAKVAQPTARKTLYQKLEELFLGAEQEEADAEATGAMDMQSTDLEDGSVVYHDGPLAVDTAVFNDEAMSEVTADGEYDTADGQVMTIAAGLCTALGPDTSTATTTTESAAVASLRKEFAQMQAKLDTVVAENTALKKLKPPVPQARVARPNADAPDPKAKPVAKAKAEHHSQL